jgi:hypothetical protein
VAAAPLPAIPEDPEDPRVILRDLPERERTLFLGQYADAVDGARDPAGFSELRRLLRAWSIRVSAVNSPGYYERTSPNRVREPAIPASDVFPDWNKRIEAARASRA